MRAQLRWSLIGVAVVLCIAIALHMRTPPEDVQASASAATTKALAAQAANVTPTESPARGPSQLPVASTDILFAGRMIDAQTRAPVTRFKIELQSLGHGRTVGPLPFQSNAGRFRIAKPPLGEWRMVVTAPGYQRFESQISIAADTKDLGDLELPMHRGRNVLGRVYDEATGNGIANANVSYRDAQDAPYVQGWRSRVAIKSRSDGTFMLEGVPPGSLIVTATAQGFAERELSVAVGPDDDLSVDIGLSAGAMIAGRLVASDGVTPITGVVGLTDIDRQSASTNNTGPEGRFTYSNLAPGRYRLAAHAREGAAERVVTLAKNEKLDDVVLVLAGGGTVRGIITGLSAAELQRTSVAVAPSKRVSIGLTAKPDERGAYSIEGAPSGSATVRATVANRRILTRTVEMPASGDLTVDFAFPKTARLSGRVTRSGKPLAGAGLGPRSLDATAPVIAATTTSATGEYAIEGLSEGEYQIIVAGYRAPTVRVVGDTTFNIDVPPRSAFLGDVTDEQTGAPIPQADVMVSNLTPGMPFGAARGRTNQFGTFMAGMFESGDYLVTVYKPGYSAVRERISIGTTRMQRAFKLRAEVGVELQVRAPNGELPPEAMLTEYLGDRPINLISIPIDANGRGFIPAAFAGSQIVIGIRGFTPVDIEKWDGQSLDMQLTPLSAE